MSTQPNAASTKNIKKMSRIPVRDSTNSRPSSAISSPARQPSRVDRVSRRAIRHISKMASDPNSALANRQPNEFSPNIASPQAISSLPISGCTTYSPQAGVAVHGTKKLAWPATTMELAMAGGSGCHSTPCWMMLQASLT